MWKTQVFRKALGPMLQQIHAEYEAPEEDVLPSVQYFFITPLNPFSNSICFSLQQEDGPEPKNDDGSSFKFLPVAPVVLFDNNAPPLSKVIMQIQPYSAKSASKRKRASDIAAPRAQTKARKMTVRKIRKEAGPSSIDQEAPIVNQV
jgi:hypothetical protein